LENTILYYIRNTLPGLSDYRMKRIVLAMVIILLLLFPGCTPRHLVVLDPPMTSSDRADLTSVDLYICPFSLINLSSKDNLMDFRVFKSQLITYLRSRNNFDNIIFVDESDKIESTNPHVVMALQIMPSISKNRTWILDLPFFYPMCGYWPLTPMWGTTRVDIHAKVLDRDKNTIKMINATSNRSYFIFFYSWYRTGPLETRLKECYQSALYDIAGQLKMSETDILAAAGSMPTQTNENLGLIDNKMHVAVIDLNAIGISNSDAMALTNRLISELFLTQRYTVLEREKIKEILSEQGFQQSGCTSSECLVEMGKLLNVEQIVSGSVGKIGSYYTIDLRRIDVQSGEILRAANVDISGGIEEVLTKGIHSAVAKISR
jgi:TolB-like protein